MPYVPQYSTFHQQELFVKELSLENAKSLVVSKTVGGMMSHISYARICWCTAKLYTHISLFTNKNYLIKLFIKELYLEMQNQ
jgi:hypothetical protein